MARKETATGLPIVYAYEDVGVLVEGTRWEPRRVFCSRTRRLADRPGRLYVVKFRRADPVSAAALISEVVSHGVLQALPIRTFEAALVRVSVVMARRYAREEAVGYAIPPGDHFGTVYRPDVIFTDPARGAGFAWELLADPQELIAIWAADSWLMNLDRSVYGNLVLEPGPFGKWHLVAADQSDCLLGAGALADGSCFERSPRHGAAAYLPLLERALLQGGVPSLRQVVGQIEGAAGEMLAEAVMRVPTAWWREANVSPDALIACLAERARRMRDIVQMEYWEGLARATQGGYRLGG